MGKTDKGLAIPAAFVKQALALPEKTEQAIAELSSPGAAGKMLDQVATMQTYARRIRADLRIRNSLAYSSLLLIAKMCEFAQNGGGTPPDYLPSEKHSLTAWRKVYTNREKLPAYRAQVVDVEEPEGEAGIRNFVDFAHTSLVTRNTGEEEWYTPEVYIEASRKVLGEIDLDPASSRVANKVVRAAKYYTQGNDGLKKKWAGRVFLNPPYSRGTCDQFVDKLVTEVAAGNTTAAILLVNNATDTNWGQSALLACASVCFPGSRIRFLSPSGKGGSPVQGQMFVYFGKDPEAFKEEFQAFGVVL